jgi:hypothetical protein
MAPKRLTTAVVAVAIAALVAPLVAAGKEGVTATLATAVPRDAAPGTALEVGWTLTFDEGGVRRPFRGAGVFVRLVSPSGAASRTAFAQEYEPPYTAAVTVPPGGIGAIEIGVRGRASGTPSDFLFPIAGDPIRAGSPWSDGGPGVWAVVAAAGSLLAAGALVPARSGRRRLRPARRPRPRRA